MSQSRDSACVILLLCIFAMACSSPEETSDSTGSDACVSACAEGTTRCYGEAVTSCELDAEGCLDWSTPAPCSSDEPFCSFGQCSSGCVDECAAGERRCNGTTAVDICGDNDNDSCLEWMSGTLCPDAQVCSNGQCADDCSDECQTGTVKCLGGGTSVCGDSNSDGCTEWGPETSCEEGYSCTNGSCEEQCADECSEAACSGDVYYECGNYDLDSCLDWSAGTSCAPANTCLIGSCTVTGCEAVPLTCDTVQSPECISSTELRTYEPVGSCSAGRCDYPFNDVVCLEGCLSGACSQVCESGTWLRYSVDSSGSVGAHTSLAVDGFGGAYISYYDASNRDLKLAYRSTTGQVLTETVDSTGEVGQYTSLKLDALGGVHIAYYDATNEDLKYAYRSPDGVITTETLDWPQDVGKYASLALDAEGGVHVAYLNDDSDDLKYAYRSPAGDVSVYEIDTSGNVGHYSSVAVDSLGGVHFSYARITYGTLKYAYRDPAGNVSTSIVDSYGSAGRHSSIGVDSSGTVHIGYSTYSGFGGGVRYARIPTSGPISIAELESSGVYDQHVALHVEKDDDIHISYFDGYLNYAYLAAPNNPPVYSRVATGAGRHSSIDIDDAGGVHVSFHHEWAGDLKYAYRCP